MHLSKVYFISLTNIALVTLATLVQAEVVNLDQVLVNKLNAHGAKITQLANPGAGFVFQSASYGGNFGASPITFKHLGVKTEPLTATSTFVGACFPAKYKLESDVTATASVGHSFTSQKSLSTDTIIKADASYGTAHVSVTTQIKTLDAKTNSFEEKQITASSASASMERDLNCKNYNQPHFFQAVGEVDKNTWFDTETLSNEIEYYYYAFPGDSNIYDGKSQFKAKFHKPGYTTAGNNLTVTLYDGNKKVIAEYIRSGEACQNNSNCGITINAPDNAKHFNMSFGGNPANISVRFLNKNGWSDEASSVNQQQSLPNNFNGSSLRAVGITNKDFITIGAQTKEVSLPISKVLSYADHGAALASDDLKVQVDGIYKATSLSGTSMQINYNMTSWERLFEKTGLTSVLSKCGGETLAEAKQSWADNCGDKRTTSTSSTKPKTEQSSQQLPMKLIQQK